MNSSRVISLSIKSFASASVCARLETRSSSIVTGLLSDSAIVLSLLDHLVRSRQHIGRNRQADLLSRLQVDDQLELDRLLHGKIGRFSAFQNLVHVSGDAPIQVWCIQA